jgi:hypothetical protein
MIEEVSLPPRSTSVLDTQQLKAAQQALREILSSELNEIVTAVQERPGPESDYYIEMPNDYTVDLDVTDLMSYVARSSNVYGRIARLAGIAKAQLDIAEGRYQATKKSNYHGANDKEREANAIRSARDEHDALLTAQALYSMADKMESAARVASESSRKLLDKVQAMQIATHREQHGQLQDRDFRTY